MSLAMGAHHYLASTPSTVSWGELPCETDTPVHEMASGQIITIDTVSHEGILPDQGRDPREFFARFGVPAGRILPDAIDIAASGIIHTSAQGPHVVTGPVAVRGAEPGDLLALDIIELSRRADYGIVSSRHGKGALPEEFPADGHASTSVFCTAFDDIGVLPLRQDDSSFTDRHQRSIRFPLNPFLGIMGVAAAGHVRPYSVPPGRYGGNLDIRVFGIGATVYLPVQVPEALFYIGDPHYSQGDGEVALTAFEAPLRATLRVEVIAGGAQLAGGRPFGETAEHLVSIGLDPDLDEAVRDSVDAALDLMLARYGVPRHLGYAYLSAACDVRVSQVVDQVKGCHTLIRKADFDQCHVSPIR
ncbi:MAG: acetamidase/formamidase family protein [Gordonia sp. (in: high G+C Gram-positive bacteria)]